MTRIRARAVATLALACLAPLVACDGSNGAPSPSPIPTVQPRRPETSLERQTRLDFEAAEKSYRAFTTEIDQIGNAGGALSATPSMKATAAGPYLEFNVALLRRQKEAGERYTGQTQIGYVRHGGYSRQQLTLDVCEDASNSKVLNKAGKQVSEGQILARSLYARPIERTWKIWDGDERGIVASCESS